VAGFVLRRLLWTIPILWVVVTIVFFMMRSIGGDPFRRGPMLGLSNVGWVKYGDYQPPAIRRNQRERYGLDLPWYQQYGNYLRGVATLDFGPSFSYRYVRVNELIKQLAPRSLALAGLAFVWALALGIPIAVLAALRPGSPFDLFARGFATLGIALPNFFVATLLVYYLAVTLNVLPTSGWTEGWTHKILPSFTLGLLPMAYCVRLLRASMLETLELDYVRMARAKGLSTPRVTGTFVIENVFSVPGIARFYVASVLGRDYTVVLGLTVMLAVIIILANLVVDILHRVLDPRLRDADAAYARA
jgi:oligopeptide transport system permease protein